MLKLNSLKFILLSIQYRIYYLVKRIINLEINTTEL